MGTANIQTKTIRCHYAKDFDPRFYLTKTPYHCELKDCACPSKWRHDSRYFCKRDLPEKI